MRTVWALGITFGSKDFRRSLTSSSGCVVEGCKGKVNLRVLASTTLGACVKGREGSVMERDWRWEVRIGGIVMLVLMDVDINGEPVNEEAASIGMFIHIHCLLAMLPLD